MAKDNSSNDGGTDPRESFEQVRNQMLEVLNKGFADAVGMLQEVGSVIEQRLEEVLGSRSGEKSGAKSTSSDPDVRETTEPETPVKKSAATKAPAKKTAAKKKTPAKKAAVKKKAPAKKAAAKKKAVAKKAPAKKAVAKESPPGGPTRDELYAEAQKLDIAGRSKMTKAQLQKAIDKAKK